MNLTKRDRYILLVVVALGLVGAYWFLALAPKRERLSALDKDLATAKATLAQSEQEKVQFAQAQVQFPSLYANLGRLGKAVPGDEETPSLLLQLNDAAERAGVDFRSIELKLDLVEKLAAAATSVDQPAAPPGRPVPPARPAQPEPRPPRRPRQPRPRARARAPCSRCPSNTSSAATSTASRA